MKTRGVFYFGKFVVMGIAFMALFTYVVMLLWNWLIPELFTGPVLTYWQTLGILVLSKILFTGLGGHRKDRSPWKHSSWKHDRMKSHWKAKFEEKMKERCAEPENQVKSEE
jgi:hypothetical protein